METTEARLIHSETTLAAAMPSHWKTILAITLNAFRESVRDRVLYNLILFVLILVGASVFISELSIDQENKFIADLGLSSMVIFGAIIAIFIGVGLVYKEIDRRTIYNLLSKPVHRYQFIIGKYFGLCLTLLVNTGVMTAGTIVALIFANKGFGRLQLAVLPSAYLIYLELALIVAVALMFSSFSTPMLSTLFSFAVYVIGHFSSDLRLAAEMSDSGLVKGVLYGLYYVMPNLSTFSFLGDASRGQMVPLAVAGKATLYAILYVVILLSASAAILQRRNFK